MPTLVGEVGETRAERRRGVCTTAFGCSGRAAGEDDERFAGSPATPAGEASDASPAPLIQRGRARARPRGTPGSHAPGADVPGLRAPAARSGASSSPRRRASGRSGPRRREVEQRLGGDPPRRGERRPRAEQRLPRPGIGEDDHAARARRSRAPAPPHPDPAAPRTARGRPAPCPRRLQAARRPRGCGAAARA